MDPVAQYLITHSFWRHNYDVSTTNKTHLFHVANSSFTPGKADLTFHRSPDSNGPIAGVCKFRHFSSDCEIGLGDSAQPNRMDWEYLHKQGFMKRIYWFRMQLDDGTKQTFTWKRTHSLGSGSENHKLVEETSQTVVAVFSSGGIFSKTTGYLDIYSNLGPRFSLMALISGIALIEKGRRARQASGGAASGGGGGGGGGGGC
ncbi:unnamed protein product [Penicillium nalgiovense]|uniref:Uncharacterized protein n=1 Tax=Penicillium nalgiovense TaxID=60175 RepID=A0A9W4MJ31_PENNA|nr:unnamed protein product [Penicillium nalgiovense]CAG7935777.1 unnamed protein product [Penicillium nalgiovense]CAG7942145.1 unnamed protein product [Penicillium nalgiovense]CAG7953425.1 unnamed protein product [Penicillium nalgiovense]CAG7953451.1 unnamed protein product [Penicillium nalgiovense]